ncbi:MAG: MATE family efflux transporter [Parasporobacterium sp.]|nr:MATE family efflux transporter [Parasporobacterium sp.]
MGQNKTKDFTKGPILGPLLKFAVPVLFALLLQTLYGAVDLLIVGQFGTTDNVSSVAMGSQIVGGMTQIIAGLATGITVLVGQFLGEKKPERAGKTIGTGIYTFAVIAAIVMVILLVLAEPMLRLFNTPESAIEQGAAYIRICGIGMVFIVAYNLIGSVFRGIGDSSTPLITVAIACAVNIGGDLLLVGVFDMKAAGAAIATVFAQLVSVVLSLIMIRRKKLPFTFSKESMKFEKRLAGGILKLGIPLGLQEIVISASFLIVSGVVNNLGVTASASAGVAGKLITFIMLLPSAYAQALSAFVAHNIGAGEIARAKKALLHGIWTSLAFAAIMFYFSFLHGPWLTGIFTSEPEVMEGAAQYLKAYAIDTFFTSFLFCLIGFFNGCGKTAITMVQGMLGVAVRVPAAIIIGGMPWANLFTIPLSTPIATVIQIIFCLICFAFVMRKLKRTGA